MRDTYGTSSFDGHSLSIDDRTRTVQYNTFVAMRERAEQAERERDELRMVLDYIDKFAGPADKTCHQPGIKLSEAARRDLADMGKIDYTYTVQP